jgi:large subunit ribosomal protein L6
MSRIGNRAIKITEGVNIRTENNSVIISGPNGELRYNLPKNIEAVIDKDEIILKRKKENKWLRSLHGLYRSILANAVEGVVKPWEKRLEVTGTGYNVRLSGENLEFKVGYSHPIIFNKVEGIRFSVRGNNKIVISGIDKQLVGQIAFKIRNIKEPDVYKGKGIKYENEWIRIKPGKKAKTEETV